MTRKVKPHHTMNAMQFNDHFQENRFTTSAHSITRRKSREMPEILRAHTNPCGLLNNLHKAVGICATPPLRIDKGHKLDSNDIMITSSGVIEQKHSCHTVIITNCSNALLYDTYMHVYYMIIILYMYIDNYNYNLLNI